MVTTAGIDDGSKHSHGGRFRLRLRHAAMF